MMKQLIIYAFFLIPGYFSVIGQSSDKAAWIWYPGDYEIWLHKEVSLRRTERGGFYPPFYRLDSHYGSISFSKEVDLTEPEQLELKSTGRYGFVLDSHYLPENANRIIVPAGHHSLTINVVNYDTLPGIFIRGKTIITDTSWSVTCLNKKILKAASGNFNNINQPPVKFHFDYHEIVPVKTEDIDNGILIDFGKEIFGYLKLKEISGTGAVNIYYGESREEALSTDSCETLDIITIPEDSSLSYTVKSSKALRYAYIIPSRNLKIGSYSLISESLPLTFRGKFRCSNERLNRIWDVSAYTLSLTTREFMLDGIKRDRWIWSGDATQSFLMNYYLFFDADVNRRTIIGERGKDPVETPINTILDYSFYWFISIYDYYLYTGDTNLIHLLYPKMITMMDFCTTRLNKHNLIEGAEADWVYLDWAKMDKTGELSAYQILFARSLEAMAVCSGIMNDTENFNRYNKLAKELKERTFELFWNDNLHALVHNRINNKQINYVTRYSNMFALMYGYLDRQKSEDVKKYVLLNDSVQRITTPYMRFYELAALCEIGEFSYVTGEILNYWGGMLNLGATTFWEVYNPKEKGSEHYAMYGTPFGRSLCHAWGASPVYLLGRYYLGVRPLSPGYKSWICEPHLGGLDWIEGSVPIPGGTIDVAINRNSIKIKSSGTGGILRFRSSKTPKSKDGKVTFLGADLYEFSITGLNRENEIVYSSVE